MFITKDTSTSEILNSFSQNNYYSMITFVFISIIATVIFIPGTLIAIVGGITYGSIVGTILVVFSTTIGSGLSFLISRYLSDLEFVKSIQKSKKFKSMDKFVKSNETDMLVVTRLLPLFPFNIQNYYYGFTSISFTKYIVVTLVTIIPATFMYCYFANEIYYDSEKIVSSIIILSIIMLVLYYIGKKILYKTK